MHTKYLNGKSLVESNMFIVNTTISLLQNPSSVSSIITKKDGSSSTGSSSFRALALIGAGVSGFFGFATTASADEAEHGLACPNYPWPHQGILSSYDHAS